MSDDFLSYSPKNNLRACDPMEILDMHGVCDYLCMSRSTIFRLINDEAIPFCRVNKKLIFIKQDLFNWARSISHVAKTIPEENFEYSEVGE